MFVPSANTIEHAFFVFGFTRIVRQNLRRDESEAFRLRKYPSQANFAATSRRDDGSGLPAGARGEATARRFAKTSDAGGEDRTRGGRPTVAGRAEDLRFAMVLTGWSIEPELLK